MQNIPWCIFLSFLQIILELVKEATPDSLAIQALINKLKIPGGVSYLVDNQSGW